MSFPKYPEYKDSGIEWLGEIPSQWQVIPLRGVARPGRNSFIDGDWIESPYITDEGVRLLQTGNIGVGSYKEQGFRYISDDSFTSLRCTEVCPGDVLICRLADPVGRACQAPDLGVKMITSVDVCIVKVANYVIPRFLVFFFSSIPYLSFMESQCRGGTRDRVSRSFLGSVRLPLPPVSEQSAIAVFLNRETAKIDVLVAEQEKLIELLKEKRQAVICHAVTKGLDPNTPMKDSGVEWLGEVPEHWGVIRLGTLFQEVNDTGKEGLPILTVSIHTGVSDRELSEDEMDRKVTRSEDISKYKAVLPGDLVYNMMRAWQGGFGAVVTPGLVSPAYVVARPQSIFETSFIELILRTANAVEEMRRWSHGVTDFRLRLYFSEFKGIYVPVPSLEEQQNILAWLNEITGKYEALSQEAQRAIDLLKERRAALISAAVTGKIDIRNYISEIQEAV